MALVRQDPWQALAEMRDEFDRLFTQRNAQNADHSRVVTSQWTPAVDVREEEGRFVIYADVPGVQPGDIEVTMEHGILTLRGERRLEQTEAENGFSRIERAWGSFYRRFSLPDTADAEAISARTENGVLQIVIPKRPETQPRRIEVAH
ncbi:MAG TPA: Hsp20/alpha crystallin family protein [Gammaproteobacteria bacterium]|nr:Hsp20/alpha crystallin family protein [Gammaproteobacteria bacterium]